MRNRVNMIYGETIFKTLKFDVEDRVNMEIAEEPCRALREYAGATVATYGIMAWDSGGGGGGGDTTDSDNDGLYDIFEEGGWDITWYDALGQPHREHVTSDPYDNDTDDDGLTDYEEWLYGLNVTNVDTDYDGLTDRQEVEYYNTNASRWDTDGDGIGDNDEFHYWLFMLYIDGDNDLDDDVGGILDSIAISLPTNPINYKDVNRSMRIVGEYDGDGWRDSGRYEIRFKIGNPNKWKAEKVEDLGEVNMAEPKTLESFINWAESRYWQPNKRVLIIVDHGSGWLGLLKDEHRPGGGSEWMSLNGLKSVFHNIKFIPDLVFFDACLMQMVEVDFEIANIVKVIVGSQDTKWMGDKMYEDLFNKLSQEYAVRNITIYLDTIYGEIIEKYKGSLGNGSAHSYYTISAVHQNEVVGNLTIDINLFANALIDEIRNGHGEVIKEIIRSTQPMHGGDFINHSYRDLYDFAEKIKYRFGENSDVGSKALYLMRAIEGTVLKESHRGGNYHGISIFLPDEAWWGDYYDSYWSKYTSLDFSSASNWDEFLYTLYEG